MTMAKNNDAWSVSQRGDLMIQQWCLLPVKIRQETRPAMQRVTKRIVSRAIRRAHNAMRGVDTVWALEWRRWAKSWLVGDDRCEESARAIQPGPLAGSDDWPMWAAHWAVEAAAEHVAGNVAEVSEAGEATASSAVDEVTATRELLDQARDIRREIPAALLPSKVGGC